MAYAGMLPSGAWFSGSARLARGEDEDDALGLPAAVALMPVFYAASDDMFSALLRIRDKGVERKTVVRCDPSAVPAWVHSRLSVSDGKEPLSQAVLYDAYGSWFNAGENWPEALWNQYLQYSVPFKAYLANQTVTATVVTNGTDVTRLVVDAANNPAGVVLSVDNATGQMQGTFTIQANGGSESVSYWGVFTPGWKEGCDCGGTAGASDTSVRPFAVGAWWRTAGPYANQSVGGKNVTVQKARIGNLVTIGEL